jgi:hypothetical protein
MSSGGAKPPDYACEGGRGFGESIADMSGLTRVPYLSHRANTVCSSPTGVTLPVADSFNLVCLKHILADKSMPGAMQPKPLHRPFVWVKTHLPRPATCLHRNCTDTGGPET